MREDTWLGTAGNFKGSGCDLPRNPERSETSGSEARCNEGTAKETMNPTTMPPIVISSGII